MADLTPRLALLQRSSNHTALLTHETDICKLFKVISIKLPGWLWTVLIHSAHEPLSLLPLPCYKSRFLAKVSRSFGSFFTLFWKLLHSFPQKQTNVWLMFKTGSMLVKSVRCGSAFRWALHSKEMLGTEGPGQGRWPRSLMA